MIRSSAPLPLSFADWILPMLVRFLPGCMPACRMIGRIMARSATSRRGILPDGWLWLFGRFVMARGGLFR